MSQILDSILTHLINLLKVDFNKVLNFIKFVNQREKTPMYLIDFFGLQGVLKWEGYFMSCQFSNRYVKKVKQN